MLLKGEDAMKVFRVKATNFSYGEDKSVVIVAETKERALEIANKSHSWEKIQSRKTKRFWWKYYVLGFSWLAKTIDCL